MAFIKRYIKWPLLKAILKAYFKRHIKKYILRIIIIIFHLYFHYNYNNYYIYFDNLDTQTSTLFNIQSELYLTLLMSSINIHTLKILNINFPETYIYTLLFSLIIGINI